MQFFFDLISSYESFILVTDLFVDSGEGERLTKDDLLREIMAFKQCDPVLYTANGTIWNSLCCNKECEDLNSRELFKNIIINNNLKLKNYLSGCPTKMYIIDIIQPSIVINSQTYYDVPHSRKNLAQETFDFCSEIMVRSLKRRTVISFEHFDQKKYA